MNTNDTTWYKCHTPNCKGCYWDASIIPPKGCPLGIKRAMWEPHYWTGEEKRK